MQRIMAGLLALGLAGLAAGGCESSRPPPVAPPTAPPAEPLPPPLYAFSVDRAWSDLLTLSGAVTPGSESPGRAYLLTTLDGLGLEVREVETPDPEVREVEPPGSEGSEVAPLRHVIATLPGASSDLFALVAPYDPEAVHTAPPLGGNAGVSGAALLLELARVLSTRQLPYTIQFVFLAGEQDVDATASRLGSVRLAERWEDLGELARLRLLVVFDRVCGAKLRIARDLGSHRMYREEFFKTAKRLGREEVFPPGQSFEQVESSHQAFLERGLRASVAIVGGADVAEPSEEGDPGDAPVECVPESLEAVGLVTLDALDTIGVRLAKIDRFSRMPLSELESAPELAPEPPLAEPAPELEAPLPVEPDGSPPFDPVEASG
jgi:hypothetical protein